MFKRFISAQYRLGKITAEQVQAFADGETISQADADEILGQ